MPRNTVTRKTSKAVQAARDAAQKDGAGVSKGEQIMVYCIEARVPIEHLSEFENDSLESLAEYGAVDIIDKTLVTAEE